MSESSSKFADGKHALEAVDRAEAGARKAAQHARTSAGRVTIAAAIILVAVVLGRVTMRRRH